MKKQCGITKFIDLETFEDPSNGYLVNDTCSFGIEIFIVKTTSKLERLAMIKDPVTSKFSWTFDNFSRKALLKHHTSDLFAGGDYRWYICAIDSLNMQNMHGFVHYW